MTLSWLNYLAFIAPLSKVTTFDIRPNRILDEHLAVVFGGIVTAFFICHLPRMVLSIHEMVIIDFALECSKYNMRGFPLWALILSKISHLLLGMYWHYC